jgi:diaminohydroxyphosphoribosylaminopyrimidine deaminase/5-amino-6-(5-phosphoribosylamino)uracil reductase
LNVFSADDHEFMARALRLAEKGLFTTTPNPRVGCVIVKDGAIVGEGWHERAGEPHAEINALRQAGERARGATVYVTLEPCSHHGRTPPCAEALIRAGVGRVVAAMEDPNPLVAGAGLARLQQAGVEVDRGLLEGEARELNIGFVFRMRSGRPFVRLKVAASLDGKTALNNGVSKWITGEAARRDAHRLRARSCAVMTGIGTVLADDPELNVRHVKTPRQPLRIVVDSRLQVPPSARILAGGGVLIATASSDGDRIGRLRDAGAEVLTLPGADGRINLGRLLEELGRRGLNEITVEAGRTLNGALVREGLADELVIYLAPLLLGDRARGMFDLPELTDMGGRRELSIHALRKVGGDLRFTVRL